MDPSNWMHTQGASCAAGETTMESGDWRDQLQRQRIVNKIMDTLKRHLPFSAYERLQDIKKIAERVEEEIYTAATSQSEYTRKTCFMMLTMETRLQNPMSKSNPTRSNSAALYNSVNLSVPFDSTAQTGNTNDGDWQEEVYQQIIAMKDLYLLDSTARTGNPNGEDWQEKAYQKIQDMKDLYLLDLNHMHQKVLSKLQLHDSLLQQRENEQLEKLKVFKNMLERFMQFLQIPKHGILANYKDKLGTYEKQIINVINSWRRKPAALQQQEHALPPPHMQSLQQSQQTHSQSTQTQSHENQINLQGSMAQMLHSQLQQQIKATRDTHLQDLRPTQGASSSIGDPTMESGDWRAQLQADFRQRITNKIVDILKMHLPFSGHEGQLELKKIAERFEEKICTAATSQSDYLQEISLKMRRIEARSQDPMSDPMQSNSASNSE